MTRGQPALARSPPVLAPRGGRHGGRGRLRGGRTWPAAPAGRGDNRPYAQDQRRVTLMAYNVANLFDTQDNPPGKATTPILRSRRRVRPNTSRFVTGTIHRAPSAKNA